MSGDSTPGDGMAGEGVAGDSFPGDHNPLGLSEEHREALREAFKNVALHRLLDIEAIEISEERSAFEMPVAQAAFNPSGNLHGGAIATLVDVTAGTAAAIGSTTFEPGKNTLVTADMHLRYLGRATGETIVAEAHVVRSGRQLVVVDCEVRDRDTGKLIATADFSSMVVSLRQPIHPEAGDASSPDY